MTSSEIEPVTFLLVATKYATASPEIRHYLLLYSVLVNIFSSQSNCVTFAF
jgi:hypothetical protein